MKAPPLPVNRRARSWYGARTAPSAAPRYRPRAVRIAHLQVAPLPPEIRQAPVDRRLTALL